MSRQARIDPSPHLQAVSAALARPGQPRPLFEALDHACAAALGHKLFTLLAYHPDAAESERCYTNLPAADPVGGRKPVTPSPWMDRLFRDHVPHIGYTAEDIRAVFFNHALIASLGCASVLNVPVVWDGRTLGTINLLHEERWYDDGDIPIARAFAALAIPGFLALSPR